MCVRPLTTTLLLALGAAAWANPPDAEPPDRLVDLTLSELVDYEVVVGASRYEQKLTEAPASVTIVSAEEIRQYGQRTLADVLRGVRGLHVTYDRNYSYLGVRGTAVPGDYNSRVLVLIDGHRINDSVFDGALLGTEFPLDIESVERVEVIRGPGSSQYGTNAVAAVINVVTKRGRTLDGGLVQANAAGFGTYRGRASYGKRFRNGIDLTVAASAMRSAGAALSFAEFAGDLTGGRVAGGDGDESAHFLLRLGSEDAAIQLLRGARRKRVPTASFGTLPGAHEETRDAITFLDATFHRALSGAVTFDGRASLHEYGYQGTYPDADGRFRDAADADWTGGEAVFKVRASQRHTLILGGEYRFNYDQEQRSGYGDALEIDSTGRSHVFAFHAQEEFHPFARLRLVGGLRWDHDSSFGGRLTPRLAAIASLSQDTVIKLLYGHAFRAPNAYELHYYDGQPALRPERGSTAEAVVEQKIGGKLRFSGSLFHTRMDDLIEVHYLPELDTYRFQNAFGVRTSGVEVELQGRWKGGVEGRASFSWQRSEDRDGRRLISSPGTLGHFQLSSPVIDERVRLGLEVEYVGQRAALRGGVAGAYAIGNLTLLVSPVVGGLDLSASVYNVLDHAWSDPGSEEHVQRLIPQDGRTFRLELGRKF